MERPTFPEPMLLENRLFQETERRFTADDLRESRLAALRLIRAFRFSVTVFIDRAAPVLLSFPTPPTLTDVCAALDGRGLDAHLIAVKIDTLTSDMTVTAKLIQECRA
jgi:hypothetical protein